MAWARSDRGDWGNSTRLIALIAASELLISICHAAIVSGGYSPAIGFVHTGKQLSFVYDIADLYKAEITIPLAFNIVSESSERVQARIRSACREKFREAKLLERILPDIDRLLQIDPLLLAKSMDYDADAALPGPLWDEPDEEDAS